MFDLNTVIEREDSFSLEMFPAETAQFRNELDRFLAPEASNEDGVVGEGEEEVVLSRFMLDLSQAVADLIESGVGQALQFVRNEDSVLEVSALDIDDSDDGLVYDPYQAEMIVFDVTDADGNSYKKVFHMLTEQVQTFYE